LSLISTDKNMTTSALTLIIPPALAMDSNYRLTVNPAAIAARDSLVVAARSIATVDAANIAESQATRKALARLRIDVEKVRVELNNRPLEIQRDTNAKSATFLATVQAEESRLAKLEGDFAAEVERIRRAAASEAARLALEVAARRLEAEQAEESRRREEEAKRLEAERAAEAARIAAAAAEASGDLDAEIDAAAAQDAATAAKEEALRARLENERLAADERSQAACAAAMAEKAIVPAAVSGVRHEWDYEVVNLRAFVQHCLDTGKSLIDYAPKRAAILNILRAVPLDAEPPVIPGLSVCKKAKVR